MRNPLRFAGTSHATSSLLEAKQEVRLATAAALPACSYAAGVLTASGNGALSVDGKAVVLHDRILVKNQASGLQNGLYYVTATGGVSSPWELTRSPDADADSEINAGIYVWVEDGNTLVNSAWELTNAGALVLGTSPLVFGHVLSFTVGDGLQLVGTTIAVDATVVRTTGAQTLADKTLAAPIAATIGPSSSHQHTIPDVSSDVFVLKDAPQTLGGKTLTAPVINGVVTTTGLTLPGFAMASSGKITGLGQGTASGEALHAGRKLTPGTGILIAGASAAVELTADRTIALDQAVAPTWSATHTFSAAAAINLSNAAPVLKATGSNAGLVIQGNKDAADSGTDITLQSTNDRTSGFIFKLINGALGTLLSITRSGAFTLAQLTTWGATLLTLTGAANSTALAANTEKSDVSINLTRTVTFATGTVTNQRAVYIQAPVYAGNGGNANFTTAATVAISGPPTTDGTITNPWTLLLESGNFGLGNGVGNWTVTDANVATVTDMLTLNHQTSGAGQVGLGVGIYMRGYNSASALTDMARIAATFNNATAGAEGVNLDFYTRTGGGALTARWRVNASGNLFCVADNTYDIGASGATRPRDLFLARNFTIGGTITQSTADTAVTIQGNRSAGSTTADVILRGSATRTAGSIVEFLNNGTTKLSIDFNGRLKGIAGNEQTTIGANGAASALTANPLGYLKYTRSDGTACVIPYYNA